VVVGHAPIPKSALRATMVLPWPQIALAMGVKPVVKIAPLKSTAPHARPQVISYSTKLAPHARPDARHAPLRPIALRVMLVMS
jgi:hypothetical protein